ncbi:MAG: biotin/lipoyl-binding protein [Micromonosporaceae bacterium]|nr:biotin/lipoyl-binding protein [Micromonosporaceae bacterium]
MKLNITVDGKTYEVEVEASEPERPFPISAAPTHVSMPAAAPMAVPTSRGPASESVADESKVCRSPVNGTVVRVVAEAGQAMQVGDVLLVLEAMKMETNITAPLDAKISKVNAQVGDPVKTGQLLIEFE